MIYSIERFIFILKKKKIYRHGDRSPSSSYPTSPVDQSYWVNGYGQLTQRGRIEQIKLGKYLRERYSQLLNSTYIASEVRFHNFIFFRFL